MRRGVYDGIGARVVEQTGFDAVYMTGNGSMASLLGKPDMGLATMTEMVMRAHQLAECVDIPLICDADTGYGGLETCGARSRNLKRQESRGYISRTRYARSAAARWAGCR